MIMLFIDERRNNNEMSDKYEGNKCIACCDNQGDILIFNAYGHVTYCEKC